MLAAGGTIRIVTPDLRVGVDMYLSGDPALHNEASGHYRNLGLDVEHPIDLVRIPIASFGHHQGYLYGFDTLATELVRAGFTDPMRCELGTSDHAASSGLDSRSHGGGAQLAVEATAEAAPQLHGESKGACSESRATRLTMHAELWGTKR
jgi:hypothetical protein